MTHKIIANISELTRRQIDELAEATGITTTAAIVAMAIDRMHREETRSQRTENQYRDYCRKEKLTPTYRGLVAWLEDGILPDAD